MRDCSSHAVMLLALGAILLLIHQKSTFTFCEVRPNYLRAIAQSHFSFHTFATPPWTHVSRYYVAMYIVEEYLHGPCRK